MAFNFYLSVRSFINVIFHYYNDYIHFQGNLRLAGHELGN